jgi:hypothetical protein
MICNSKNIQIIYFTYSSSTTHTDERKKTKDRNTISAEEMKERKFLTSSCKTAEVNEVERDEVNIEITRW